MQRERRIDMSIDKKKIKKTLEIMAVAACTMFIGLRILAKKKKISSIYKDDDEQKNPFEGKKVVLVEDENEKENADGIKGHLVAVGESNYHPGFYERKIKRVIDIILSFGGLIILSPMFAAIAIAIMIEDPGPVLFTQKRVGQNKRYFKLHKFRSMKMSTPHDVPTHQLDNPEQYITRVGKFIRAHSLDELPQIWDIFLGNMSVIGPRPALWNQEFLIAERDKYDANDVKPGLTGWAQINGRDELEILDKAKFDGEYVANLGVVMDFKCFLGSLHVFGKDESLVEGGTREIKKEKIVFENNRSGINQKKVSVIVATYRRKETLKKALISLANQTYSEIEIVLVDDNGDKNWNSDIASIVTSFKDSFPDISIKYIVNKNNHGSAKSRNIGIKASSGDYITFLDDDDLYLPDKIKTQLSYMLEYEADYSLTDLKLYCEDERLEETRVRNYIKKNNENDLIKYHLMYHMTGTDTMMFKKEYLLQINGFSAIDVGDEFYLMMKAIRAGGVFCYVPTCDVKAYVHTGTGGLSSGKRKIEGENRLFEYKKQYFDFLDNKSIRYIKMRHYAVLAYANLRMGQYMPFGINAAKAFFISPIFCTGLILGRK